MPEPLSPNSARYWLPRIQELDIVGLLIPKTITVPYDHHAAVSMMEGDGKWEEWEAVQAMVWEIAQRLGSAFVRTDLASAKHDGPGSYKIVNQDDVNQVLSFTIQDNEIKFWPAGPYPTCFLVREFLELPAPFTAFDGHPVAREWRYFATPLESPCKHFYWPEDAILQPDTEGWEKLLADLARESPPIELDEIACRAAEVCPAAPAWSIDFAQDINGCWYLIDMATAESSWHPDHE